MQRLAALMLGAFAGAATASGDPASGLVRAMRLDELAAVIANDHATRAAAKGRDARRKQDCVVEVRPASLSDDLTRALRDYLSPDEIATAAAFYATSAGAKVVEHTFSEVGNQLAGGDGPPAPPPATTPEEDVTFDAFAKTGAGKKFVDSGFLLNTPPVDGVIDASARRALARCRKSPSLTEKEIVPKQVESPLEREPQSQ